MLEFLQLGSAAEVVVIQTLLVRLLLAWLAGVVVALAASRFRTEPAVDQSLSVTLVLMSILIAMATQIIGDNVARAFSLVGALSIVRFRTAVASAQDVAFVLAAVVVGMAIGAGQYLVALAGLTIVFIALQVQLTSRMEKILPVRFASEFGNAFNANGKANGRSLNNGSNRNSVSGESLVSLPGPLRVAIQVSAGADDSWEKQLQTFCKELRFVSVETIRRGASYEHTYLVELADSRTVNSVVRDLQQLPAIESLSFKAID